MMPLVLTAYNLSTLFKDELSVSDSTAMVLAAIVHVTVLGAFFGLPAGVMIWAERKVSGRIQDRLGPTRVGGKFGWLQSLADGAKLVQKEDLAPAAADQMLFRVAPYIVVIASFAAFIVLPFADGLVAVSMDVGLFLLLAILSLEVVGVILAGYSSGSKWSLFGAIREAAQMVSYEIPLAICVLIPIVAVGSLNLGEIGYVQEGGIWNWLIFHDPFTFLAFFAFFVCATASCKRAPFDLAEAESELVAGFLTEYSGMRWSFFFLAEYASMFVVCGLASLLFLGGWDDGFGIVPALFKTEGASDALLYFANLIGMLIFITKACLLVCVQIWVRWTLPRLRIDQVITTCLKYLVPISCFLFLGAIIWPLVLLSATQSSRSIQEVTGVGVSPIVIRTSKSHRLKKGNTVQIEGVGGNTAANGQFIVTIINEDSFSLDEVGDGDYTGGGTLSYGGRTTWSPKTIGERMRPPATAKSETETSVSKSSDVEGGD